MTTLKKVTTEESSVVALAPPKTIKDIWLECLTPENDAEHIQIMTVATRTELIYAKPKNQPTVYFVDAEPEAVYIGIHSPGLELHQVDNWKTLPGGSTMEVYTQLSLHIPLGMLVFATARPDYAAANAMTVANNIFTSGCHKLYLIVSTMRNTLRFNESTPLVRLVMGVTHFVTQ